MAWSPAREDASRATVGQNPRMKRLPAAVSLAASALVLVPVLASCSTNSSSGDTGSAGGTSSPSATANPAVCADLSDLKASMADLKNVKVGQGGLSDLGARLGTMQSQVQQLSRDARSEFSPETAAVRSAADGLQKSLKQATRNPSLDSLTAVKNSVSSLGASFDALTTAVGDAC